jgi:thioredoxin 1
MIQVIKDSAEFDTSVNGLIVVDFYADWCGPCKMMTPVLEQLVDTYPDITVLKVDVDSFPELSNNAGVTNIPTLDIYENGIKKLREIGYVPKPILLSKLETQTTFKRKI